MTVLCALFTVTASAEAISGNCGEQGDNVTWFYEEDSKTLTIQGNGRMADYIYYIDDDEWTSVDNPWSSSFYNTNIENIIIDEGVTYIGAGSFLYMYELKNIEIPESVEGIGGHNFDDCSKLEKIVVDSNNKFFSSDKRGALFNKDKTEFIKYPIGNKSKEYKMPDTVKSIGEAAFLGSFYLEDLSLSNQLEEIKYNALGVCVKLKKLDFPDTLRRIDKQSIYFNFLIKEIEIPENVEEISEYAMVDCISAEKIIVKGMNTSFGEGSICLQEAKINEGIPAEEFADIYVALCTTEEEEMRDLNEKIQNCFTSYDEAKYCGTIICHAGSTAEAYAKENGIDYELVHFYGDWSYDWDNLVRSHKCDICGYTETEPLEKTEDSGVEIIKPIDPDTEFIVEEITKNGDKYAVIEKTLNENLEGSYSILKTFDITLKNKNGVHVQPNGTVKVKLPLDWDKDDNYKVYRVNDDGTLTDMGAYRQGSHMVFDSNHFSVYVIVDESPEQPGNDSPISFLNRLINMFKDFINKIIEFFRSIGDLT